MTIVTLLVGEAVDAGALLRSALGDRDVRRELSILLGDHELQLVTLGTASPESFTRVITVDPRRSRRQRALDALGGAAATRLLGATAPGRLLLSLSPLAPSRVFQRAVAADEEATAVIARSSVLIAVDQAAALVAWNSRRRHPEQRAFWGIDQTLRVLGAPS